MIQHRKIIKYKVESPSDYASLATLIEERCKALLTKRETRASIPSVTSGKRTSTEFQPFELACLVSIGMQSSSATVNSWVSVYLIKGEMETLGYNNLASNVALMNLSTSSYVSEKEMHDMDSSEPHDVCQLTLVGWEWVNKNIASLNIKAQPKKTRQGSSSNKPNDDEIPF